MLKFGTVGSGWIADEYIHGAIDSGLWELSAVYSRSEERAKEFAKKHNACLIFTDLTEMAKCDDIDAVYIASPNALHYEQCRLFLEHKKHVICEKPLCAQSENLKSLQALAQKNGVIYLEAIMHMHLPQRELLKEALSKIGKITMCRIDFCQRSSKLDAYLRGELPNIFNPKMETGALMDLGVYCLYPALWLFGKPESFSADAVLLDNGIDLGGVVTLHYGDKLVVLTYSKFGQSQINTEFQGTDGTVVVSSISRLADIEVRLNDGSVQTLCGGEDKFKLMGYEAKDFYRFIIEREKTCEEYRACSEMSLAVCGMMEEIRKRTGLHFPSDD